MMKRLVSMMLIILLAVSLSLAEEEPAKERTAQDITEELAV